MVVLVLMEDAQLEEMVGVAASELKDQKEMVGSADLELKVVVFS